MLLDKGGDMGDRFYSRIGNEITELSEEKYMDESELQELIAGKPELIIPKDENYKLLLISREMGIPDQLQGGNRWSIDHFFVGDDGIPTFVEVKQSSDSRIYREVVAQMLDYVSNSAKYLTEEMLIENLSKRLESKNISPKIKMKDFLCNKDVQLFWKKIIENLRDDSGEVRLVFVADKIPPELKTIIEFLEYRFYGIFVYGVEVKKYSENHYSTRFTRFFDELNSEKPSKSIRWNENSFLRWSDR